MKTIKVQRSYLVEYLNACVVLGRTTKGGEPPLPVDAWEPKVAITRERGIRGKRSRNRT